MRILIAEDDPISRRVLQATLDKWGYEVVVTCDGLEAWETYQSEDPPRLAILDWMMPEMDGLEVCQKIRALRGQDYTYIILLTAKGRREDVIEGLEVGADDYIVKPFDAGELKVRLRAATRILNLQEDLLSAQEALRLQATHDSLTGLKNRHAILSVMTEEIERSKRETKPAGVILADIDHFKRINDTYGHRAGDAVLHSVASRMASAIRPYDHLGRYGGEEFLLFLPGCDGENATQRANIIREKVMEDPIIVANDEIFVTLSLGVSVCDPNGETSPEVLIHSADEAMYKAKSAGRNRVELARRDCRNWST